MLANETTFIDPDDVVRLRYNRLHLHNGESVHVDSKYLPFWRVIVAKIHSPARQMIALSRTHYVRATSIDHAFSVRPQVCVVLDNGERHINYLTLQSMLRQYPDLFLQVHRRSIIGVQHIKEIRRESNYWVVDTMQQRSIVVSKAHVKALRQLGEN